MIKEQLMKACITLWHKQGYKKTSIADLCQETNISIGTYYKLFPTKEGLFLAVGLDINQKIHETLSQTIQKEPSVLGLRKALITLYELYEEHDFLRSSHSDDLKSFLDKLSVEQKQAIQLDSTQLFSFLIKESNLKIRKEINQKQVFSSFSILLLTISEQDTLNHTIDTKETYVFLVDLFLKNFFIEK
ncbi:TetR/AcrR family transcriptional regulator [Enterococcus sp. AZ194]|uniref:TetR/AcrR family transcriptional regulator n=1 Tax=Enterococcus sp. AZ194 TaxID=2774629 RepID=UPI003F6876A9